MTQRTPSGTGNGNASCPCSAESMNERQIGAASSVLVPPGIGALFALPDPGADVDFLFSDVVPRMQRSGLRDDR